LAVRHAVRGLLQLDHLRDEGQGAGQHTGGGIGMD
jgi:hypothetical protein